MKRNFYLQNPSAAKPTPIIFTGIQNGLRKRISLGESINPIHWDSKKQLPKPGARNAKRIRELIEAVNGRVTALQHEKESKGKVAHIDWIFYELRRDDYKDPLEYAPHYLEVKGLGKKSHERYNRLLKYLEDFKSRKGISLDWSALDSMFFKEFDTYLRTTWKNGRTTRNSYFGTLKTIIKAAQDDGLHSNGAYKYWKMKVIKNKQTALNDEELFAIHSLAMPNERLERIRDIFILNCYTGLRFSDWNLKPEFIREKKITAMNQKTKEIVELPIHPIARYYLDKYESEIITRSYNTEYYCLRDLFEYLAAELDFLNDELPYWIEVDGEYMKSSRKRVDAMGAHTARRSFCSNLYRNSAKYGLTVRDIMAFSGHTYVDTFMNYICVESNMAEQVTEAMEREFNELLAVTSDRRPQRILFA